ncbi:MAG TPA: LamG domain-containing protein [Pirellulales bacterium]|nr:LamG domain-containing protein [Pirellulales bacterium]
MLRRIILACVLLAALAFQARAALVDSYTFDDPAPGDPFTETDQGSNAVNIWMFYGGLQRVSQDAFPGGGNALQAGAVSTPPGPLSPHATSPGNDDMKAGVSFASSSVSPLIGTKQVTGITIMGWFKPTQPITGTTSLMALLRGDSGADDTPHDGRALMEIENVSGTYRITGIGRRLDSDGQRLTYSNLGIDNTSNSQTSALPLNTWTYLAAVFNYDTGSITLYRNGAVLSSTAPTGDSWQLTSGTDRTSNTASLGIKIGGQINDDTTPFTGFIDEVQIYNEALSATGSNSIQSIYLSQVPEPSTLVLAAWGGAICLLKARRLFSSRLRTPFSVAAERVRPSHAEHS